MDGRPPRRESLARKASFLKLVAEGATPAAAQEQSGIAPLRALKILSEPEFEAVVAAVRATGVPQSTVVTMPSTAPAAA